VHGLAGCLPGVLLGLRDPVGAADDPDVGGPERAISVAVEAGTAFVSV